MKRQIGQARAAAPSSAAASPMAMSATTASAMPTSAPAGNSTRPTKRRSCGRTRPSAPIASHATMAATTRASAAHRHRRGAVELGGRRSARRCGIASLDAHAGLRAASGASRKMPGPSPDAASTMPSDRPNFILRGARFATIGVSRPTRSSGSYADLMPANTVRVRRLADVERQLDQLVGAVDVLGVDDARDAQVDLGEVVDRDRCRRAGVVDRWLRGAGGRAGAQSRLPPRAARRRGCAPRALRATRRSASDRCAPSGACIGSMSRRRLPRVAPHAVAAAGRTTRARRAPRRPAAPARGSRSAAGSPAAPASRRSAAASRCAGSLASSHGLRCVERLVDPVGDAHRLAQHLAELARLVVSARGLRLRAARSSTSRLRALGCRLRRRRQLAVEVLA